MRAKHWDSLLSLTYKADKLSPVYWVRNFIWGRLDKAQEAEAEPYVEPDYFIGRIESIGLSSERDELIIVLTDETGHTSRIFSVFRESTMSFNVLGDYGLFKKTGERSDVERLCSTYRLLFVKNTHKEAQDSFLDFYDAPGAFLLDLCDEDIKETHDV